MERKFWSRVRNRQFEGYKFRFQASIGPFVVDLLCASKRLIVELDGGQHSVEADRRRTAYLEAEGYTLLRFWNNEVVENIDGVLQSVREKLAQPPAH